MDLFTKVSHPCDVTCTSLTQNLFPAEKFSRSISLNAHYHIIAFNNPRDTLGLRTLAQQAFAGQVPFVWESFQDATSQPFGYLMLDLHLRTQNIQRVKTRILPTQHRFPIVYVNKEMHKTDEPLQSTHRAPLEPRRKKPRGRTQRGGMMVLHSGTKTGSNRVEKRNTRLSKLKRHLPYLLKGNIIIPKSSFERLKPYKDKLLYLTRKKPSLKQKKEVLNQKGGFLPALAGLIAPVAVDLLGKLFK